MSFENLGLRTEILTGIKFQGYTQPTPIQEQAIPIILKGGDILAGAQTGTGKTAAFTLPILHLLSTADNRGGHRPRALVLTPTRELAAQVGESVELYGKGLDIRSTVIFGGVGINPQKQKLRKGVDIVVGTPGRLLDLAGQKALDLSRIEYLILDEADRMLDMGFIHDIKKIIKLVPEKRQTLFFSATYSKDIKALSESILRNPSLVEVARQNTSAETVDQSVYHVGKNKKRNLLSSLIRDGEWNQVLVFTRTKHGANKLTNMLIADGITAAAIHGNKSQNARTRALADFKAIKVRVLVATDIAARGIDIDRLPHVVNYELPEIAEDYVHRIGRTGRAGCSGEAISLVAKEEASLLFAIEKLINKKVNVKEIPGITEKAPSQSQAREAEKELKKRRNDNRQNRSQQRKPGSGGPKKKDFSKDKKHKPRRRPRKQNPDK
ncbi:DEAD/DEAH box helicase-like protein [Lentisphaera araneosa HTCC2155]|uniref:DEAD-box ATP-dependent RNA helicase RhpA n=1 Tax=Lentisphaera araneosa HTCC2155 TaxID=313628 RepID=A6DS24_9BACT|nr:DEAD/DEAH box helicase [Lentisphaera araneosa]EDM25599.1 DEAD/DEAH box helicase-like protein [Lentisphaera araneosa HTCC2155]